MYYFNKIHSVKRQDVQIVLKPINMHGGVEVKYVGIKDNKRRFNE